MGTVSLHLLSGRDQSPLSSTPRLLPWSLTPSTMLTPELSEWNTLDTLDTPESLLLDSSTELKLYCRLAVPLRQLPGRVNSQSIPVDHFPVSMGLLVQHDQRTNFYLRYIRSKNHLCTCTFQPES